MLLSVAEHVVVEERNEGAEGAESYHGIDVQTCADENNSVESAGDGAKAGSQAVDAVDKVDGVGDEHGQQHGQQDGSGQGHGTHSKESVEVVELQAARDDENGGKNLRHELGAVFKADEVISDTHEVEGHYRACEEAHDCDALVIDPVENCGKVLSKEPEYEHHGEHDGGEEGDSAKTGNRRGVNLPFVRIVK